MKWRVSGKGIYEKESDLVGVMKSVDLAHTVVCAHNDETTFVQVVGWIEEMNEGLWTAQEVIAYLQGRRRG